MKCAKDFCICTHTAPCERGWISHEIEELKLVKLSKTEVRHDTLIREVVRPCPSCYPEKAELFRKARNREELGELLRAQSKMNQKKFQEEESWGRTRTL
jgi:hypothetical protein